MVNWIEGMVFVLALYLPNCGLTSTQKETTKPYSLFCAIKCRHSTFCCKIKGRVLLHCECKDISGQYEWRNKLAMQSTSCNIFFFKSKRSSAYNDMCLLNKTSMDSCMIF